MMIEQRRRRTSRRLFGDRERIEVLETRELLTHLSGASIRTVQPSVLAATVASQLSSVGPYGATPPARGAHASSVPVAPMLAVHPVLPNPAYPMVSEAHAISRHGRVTAFVVSFTQDMAPGPATDLANYDVTEASRGLSSAAVAIPISAATYDPVNRAVTLIPAQPAPVGHFSIEGPGSQGKTNLTDVNGVPIDSGQAGPTPNAELYAAINPRGDWFGPAKVEQVARRAIAYQMKHSGLNVLGQAAEAAGTVFGAIISPFFHH
jgi:hypothetical protein